MDASRVRSGVSEIEQRREASAVDQRSEQDQLHESDRNSRGPHLSLSLSLLTPFLSLAFDLVRFGGRDERASALGLAVVARGQCLSLSGRGERRDGSWRGQLQEL